MKRLYIFVSIVVIAGPAEIAFSQCTCSDGSTPDSIAYHQHYDSIISTNTAMTFPQFNDTVGLLTCLRLSDTVTTVVNYNLENNLDTAEDYNFETYRRSQFTGPGGFFSSVLSPPKDYGPYSLAAYDPVGHDDEVDVGPDTVFNKNAHTQYFAGGSAYYGQGNVTLNYLTTSTFTILTGSDNAIIKLKAYTRLDAELVYYWCPFNVLETNLTAFTLSMEKNNIIVNWKLHDGHPTNMYEVEVSANGKDFSNLGQGVSTFSVTGTNSQFVYLPEKNFTGNLYFRIKETDNSGRITYSEIRSVYVDKLTNTRLSLYPNPAVSGVHIQFVNSTGSNYRIELINSYGQLLFLKNYSLNKSSTLNIEWPDKPAPGTYFLKVTDIDNRSEQVERLKIL